MYITEIKARLSITTLLHHYGLCVNKHDMLCCPFHKDKTPSLKIYPKTNTFHCFGCGANGDQIEFIQLKENCTKHQAIRKAESLINPTCNTNPKPMEQKEEKNLLPRIAILSKIARDSQVSFKRTAKARDYIKSRKLDPDKTQAGYIGTDFGKGWNRQLQESALELGILKESRQNSIVPKFKNCVLFFTRNQQGQIIDLYGRSIMNNDLAKHFYLNGHHQGIYPKYPDPQTKKLILTESFIDCATLEQQEEITKHFYLIALFGTNGFTQEIRETIKGLTELEEVILFFDGDQAGEKAVLKHSKTLLELNPSLTISFVKTPQGEDINSLLQSLSREERNGRHDPQTDEGGSRTPLKNNQYGEQILQHLIKDRKPITGKKEEEKQSNDTETPPDPLPDPSNSTFSKLSVENPDKITYHENNLRFTIWGGIEKDNIHRLKINLLVQPSNDDFKYYQDDVNLYSNGQLQRYIRGACEELECSTTVLKTTLFKLQTRLEEYRLKQVEENKKELAPKVYQMSREEELRAMNFLKVKNLVKNTLNAIEKTGLVGEQKNGLLLFFLYLSRLMDEPLHAIIYGKSGSGKTYLQTKISECLPEESLRTITSLTENTLYYSSKDFWKHKVLLIEDLEGVYNAFLPLREFMSKQSITKLTTDKDSKGNNVQKVLFVEGPICVSGATTQGNIYEDNANRSFLLHIDESSAHLNQVMEYQRKIQAGLVNETNQEAAKQILKNAQRLLRKVKIINPYAPDLRIPDCVFKKLRTNMHYLKLIEIITFYHQHQREWKKDKDGRPYIETTPEDLEVANWLVKETLLRKSDELSGDLRGFFESLKYHLQSINGKEEQTSFYAKDIRKHLRMHPQKLSRYLSNLEHRGFIKLTGRNRQTGYEYQVISWDDYQALKNDVNLLDRIFEKIKQKKDTPELLHTPFTSLSQVEM